MDYFNPLPALPAVPSFSGSTLLLPQPSLSSLAQLATDLLIHTYGLEKIGYLGLRDFVPAVSGLDGVAGEEQAEGVLFGVEVFQTPSGSLTVVLPRSPVIRARRAHHLEAMRAFIEQAGFAEVLLVAGVDAALRGDEGLNAMLETNANGMANRATPLRHFVLPTTPSSSSPFPLAQRLASLAPPYASSSPSGTTSSTSPAPSIPLIPHGGLTRKLIEALSLPSSPSSSSEANLPPVSALLIYTSEGDAADSAYFLADALADALGKELEEVEVRAKVERLRLNVDGEQGERSGIKWKTPRSWETGLMGPKLAREAGREMFG
ncbi:SPOSA6832_02384, partial [Sporobolomyces salmonicolor]